MSDKKTKSSHRCPEHPVHPSTVIRFIMVGLSAWLLMSAKVEGQDNWPQFHGPRRDNISHETGFLKAWPDEGPSLVWTTDGLGHGFSSIATAEGIICTAGNIEKDTVVTALNMKGEVLWRSRNGKAWTRDYPGTRSTPTIDGARIYHQSPLGHIVCLKTESGEVLWEVDILTKGRSENSRWALAESLLIDGDRLISCPGGPETCMVALDKHTGSIIWKAPSTGELAGYSSPILIECKGLRIVATLTAKGVIGVNAESTQETVYCSTIGRNQRLCRFRVASVTGTFTVLWPCQVRAGLARGLTLAPPLIH